MNSVVFRYIYIYIYNVYIHIFLLAKELVSVSLQICKGMVVSVTELPSEIIPCVRTTAMVMSHVS